MTGRFTTAAAALVCVLGAATPASAQAPASGPDAEYTALIETALDHAARGEHGEARTLIERARALRPNRPYPLRLRAELRRAEGHAADAVRLFHECAAMAEAAVGQEGTDPVAHVRERAACLYGAADTLTRAATTPGALRDARREWEVVLAFALAHPRVLPPSWVRTRLGAIDTALPPEPIDIATEPPTVDAPPLPVELP